MKFTVLMAACAVVALSAGAARAEEQKTVSVTQNPDGSTTTTTTRYFIDRDANNNGILDTAEFPGYVYRHWDRNNDGFINSDEWDMSTVRWYAPGTTTYKTYTAWDKNGDGRIDSSEFDRVVTDTKLYSSWDSNADNTIESDEYAAATFRMYDVDNDGQLSLAEWKRAQ